MTSRGITEQLERIASAGDFASRSSELSRSWASEGAGLEFVEPILRFIESHAALHSGVLDPLLHFMQRFEGLGYEDKLRESVARQPTACTITLLHQVIDAASPQSKREFLAVLKRARLNPHADASAVQAINRHLKELAH